MSGVARGLLLALLFALTTPMSQAADAGSQCLPMRSVRSADPETAEKAIAALVARARHKIGFVIGNDYEPAGAAADATLPKLVNGKRDAVSVAALFARLQMDVVCLLDPTAPELEHAADLISARHAGDGLVAFYFAGHGYSLGGENYLALDDASRASQSALLAGSVAASDLANRLTWRSVEQLRRMVNEEPREPQCNPGNLNKTCLSSEEAFLRIASPRPLLFVLDMCRTRLALSDEAGALPRFVEPTNEAWPDGTLPVLAAGAGEGAEDRPSDKNGLFVQHFLKQYPPEVSATRAERFSNPVSVEERVRRALLSMSRDARANVRPRLSVPLTNTWSNLSFLEGDGVIDRVWHAKLDRPAAEVTANVCALIAEDRGLLRSAIASTSELETKRVDLRAKLLDTFLNGCLKPEMMTGLAEKRLSLGVDSDWVTYEFVDFNPVLYRLTSSVRAAGVAQPRAEIEPGDRRRIKSQTIVAGLAPTNWQRLTGPFAGGRLRPPGSSPIAVVAAGQIAPGLTGFERREVTKTLDTSRLITVREDRLYASAEPFAAEPVSKGSHQIVLEFEGSHLTATSAADLIAFAQVESMEQAVETAFVLIPATVPAAEREALGDLRTMNAYRFDAVARVFAEQRRQQFPNKTAGTLAKHFGPVVGHPDDAPIIAIVGLKRTQALLLKAFVTRDSVPASYDYGNWPKLNEPSLQQPDPYQRWDALTPAALQQFIVDAGRQ